MNSIEKCCVLVLVVLSAVFGCTSDPKVYRTTTDEIIDLSGRWNDTDSRLTSQRMVDSLLSAFWLETFLESEDRIPIVIVGSIRNRSSEHIETGTFIRDIERALINSGRVGFVAGGAEREELRSEREDQQSFATEETTAALAAETGADFMLQGVITNQVDAIEGKRVVLYKVDLELIDLENNQKVWIDKKEIKKFVKQRKASW